MAFVSSAVTPFRTATLRSAKTAQIRGVRVSAVKARRATVAPGVAGARMDMSWEGHPPSEVLGVGKDIPSSLFLFSSVIALALGSYCVAQSNIFSSLSADTVNPQFIVGSLLVPISWGLYVFPRFAPS